MIEKILDDLVKYQETKWKQAPSEDYAIYNDSLSVRGCDSKNLLAEHNVTIELYEYQPNKALEEKIETRFDELGIPYDKEERYYLDTEKLYQVIYEFTYLQKKGA